MLKIIINTKMATVIYQVYIVKSFPAYIVSFRKNLFKLLKKFNHLYFFESFLAFGVILANFSIGFSTVFSTFFSIGFSIFGSSETIFSTTSCF